ncbi:MAG: DUF4838 domain-containing protein [Victivallales bacterium]
MKYLIYTALLLPLFTFGFEIRLPEDAAVVEKKAAEELKNHLEKMTGQKEQAGTEPCFRLVSLPAEDGKSWRIRSIPGGVELSGERPRGILYAVYHYLEDVCGVRWWNPWEEHIPAQKKLPAANLNLAGNPAFEVRDIYSVYGNDDGRFSVRQRLTHNGNQHVAPEYGGYRLFGPPYSVHTFAMYIPAAAYFKTHPEWFALRDGKRENAGGSGANGTQLCLSNRELRQEVLKRLRMFIRQGRQRAAAAGMPPPEIYDISQNDNQRYCQCAECKELAAKYGNTQSGALLDFINEIASAIAKEEPNIQISTLIYQYTEQPPSNIRPEKNVLIVLCDTLSNAARPVTLKDNPYFHKLLADWSTIAPNLRIWDYCVTYQMPNELPYPSEYTYADDLKLFRDSNVKQVFTEMEYPLTTDARDYKVYLRAKFLENPDSSFEALSREFTDGFYGPAGKLFRDYRELLHRAAQKAHPHISMYPTPNAYTHLTLDTMVKAHGIFDKGDQILSGDKTLLRRWRHARLPLDRASLILGKKFMGEYLKKHGNLDGYPLDRAKISKRIREAWREQAEMRLRPKERAKSISEMETEIRKFSMPVNLKALTVPEKFSHIPAQELFDYTLETASRWKNTVKLVEDPESEAGTVACLEFPNEDPGTRLEKYRMPLLFGIYSPARKKSIWAKQLSAKEVRGRGYQWYKLGTSRLTPDCYMFFFWSWYIQQGIADGFDPNQENRRFDIWLRMKLTGPAYPYGKKDEKNAIWIERIILVRK